MPPAILLMRGICVKLLIWTTQKHIRSPVLSLAYAKHTQPQSLSSALPGSSLQLLWCQQHPPKHTDTSFHIHNYTRKKLKGKKNTAHLKLFTHAEDERDTECSKNTLECTFFLFAVYLHYFPWDNSSDTAAALNNGDISCYSCFLWVVKGPEEDQIYIQPLIYIFTSTLH